VEGGEEQAKGNTYSSGGDFATMAAAAAVAAAVATKAVDVAAVALRVAGTEPREARQLSVTACFTLAQAAASAKAAAAAAAVTAAAAPRYPRRSRQRAQRDSVQYSCKTKLRAYGQAEVHVSSGEESEAVTKEEDGSEDEFVLTERKEPVPKWEVLAENRAVWEQFCKQLGLGVGSLG
jgi:hypothetical protein